MRIVSGFTARAVGWDMTAALALGDALGVDKTAVAMLLPDIEQVAFSVINQQEGSTSADMETD